jgi:hypothetical protein
MVNSSGNFREISLNLGTGFGFELDISLRIARRRRKEEIFESKAGQCKKYFRSPVFIWQYQRCEEGFVLGGKPAISAEALKSKAAAFPRFRSG